MKNWIVIGLVIGAGVLFSGCYRVSWVNDVTSSPDGTRITVVGAEHMFEAFGSRVVRPMQWNCTRDGAGQLSCAAQAVQLPQMP